ncbi:actin family protein [Plasmodium falciparum RAJ116]|uniref:Actin family protein n=1 Tax=Plasmodium falciparum RAJ116 TaxID=580058 RepID=A0A0L0CU57_PLAFA|nr:actin family protein [Plasmodium falciparum RAJ116]
MWENKNGFRQGPIFLTMKFLGKISDKSKDIKFGIEAVEDYMKIRYNHTKSHMIKENDFGHKEGMSNLVNVKMTFADPRHPLSNNNFNDVLEIYNYLINKLNINTDKYNILIVIPERVEKLFLSNILRWAFKIHNFLSISFIYNALAATYYYGIKTVDIGESGSRVTPVAENHGVFFDFIKNNEISGYLISKYISNFVKIDESYIDYILIQDYKEMNSYVSLDVDKNIKMYSECNGLIKPYKIPYTNIYIDPKSEILSHEIFFQPEFLAHMPGNFYKQNIISLSQLIFEAISSCPIDLRKQFFDNIILIGGVSNCINFSQRLKKNLLHILKEKNYSEKYKYKY